MGSVAARKRAAFGNALREAAAALGLAHEGTDPAVEDAAELDADFDGPQQVAAFDLEEDRCRDRQYRSGLCTLPRHSLFQHFRCKSSFLALSLMCAFQLSLRHKLPVSSWGISYHVYR